MKVSGAVLLFIFIFHVPMASEVFSRIEGIVKDKDTGFFLEKAEVLLYEYDHITTKRRLYRSESTNDIGHFFINNIRVKEKARYSYFLSCRKMGYVPLMADFQVRLAKDISKVTNYLNIKQGENRFIEIELEKGGSIKAKLFKKEESGISPFISEKIDLLLRNLDKNLYGQSIITLSSEKIGPEGYVAFDSLAPGDNYSVVSIIEGLPWVNQIVSVSKNIETELTHTYDLTDETGISGLVTRNNQPLDNISVYVSSEQKKFVSMIIYSLKNGSFRFINLLPGTYKVSFLWADESDEIVQKDFWVVVHKNRSTICNLNLE